MTREELVVRVTDHLRHTPIAATPAFEAAGWPWSAHGPGSGPGGHGYDGACALCRMDIPEALPTVVGVVLDFLATIDEEGVCRGISG